MKRKNIFKFLFLSLIISSLSVSCGLIDKMKSSDQPTDSKTAENTVSAEVRSENGTADDLFSKTMNETKEETKTAAADAPTDISNADLGFKEEAKPEVKLEAIAEASTEQKSLEDQFTGTAPKTAAEPEIKKVKVEESLPEIKSEPTESVADNAAPGTVMNYKVQKGETLMQIAFKIYGDVSKWKDIKNMNGAKLSKNSALRTNMELKYKAPAKAFVWSPEGTAYLIKTGETLGTISKSVYQTPTKWKKIWENNKPLIKNPNVIYAGFTLYYKGTTMANYVQPEAAQPKVIANEISKLEESKAIEEVKVDQAISKLEKQNITEQEIDLTNLEQAAPQREKSDLGEIKNIKEEMQSDAIIDEALVH